MFKTFLTISVIFILLESCSSLKPLSVQSTPPEKTKPEKPPKKEKFLDDISMTPEGTIINHNSRNNTGFSNFETIKKMDDNQHYYAFSSAEIEIASFLQIKYAIILDTEVEAVRNMRLFQYIDSWYGTPYCMGGSTKNCIDCSAFVQLFFSSIYGITLPRTARDQYKKSRRISRTKLQEGDLLFYNTRGGISHVGIYLQNNRFVHAASSGGVMISDMFDPYWMRKFMGVGRIER